MQTSDSALKLPGADISPYAQEAVKRFDMYVVGLYATAGLAIVLIIMLCAQVYRGIDRTDTMTNKIAVDVPIESATAASRKHGNGRVLTPKEPVKTVFADKDEVATALVAVRDKIRPNIAVAINPELVPMIDKAIANLTLFIASAPNGGSDLCAANLGARTAKDLSSTITPFPSTWRRGYDSLMEWETDSREQESDPAKRLEYLIKNIDIAVYLLRNDICDFGRIDLVQLRDILLEMEAQLHVLGGMAEPHPEIIFPGKRPYTVNDPWHGNHEAEGGVPRFDVPTLDWKDMPDFRTYAFRWDREVELNENNNSH